MLVSEHDNLKMMGCVSTTKGDVPTDRIHGVLIHEHVFNRFPYWLREKSEQYTINELNRAYESGIDVIVDLTPYTKPYDYYRVIDETPVNIITCTGFYTVGYVPAKIKNMSASELINSLSKKIENGVGSRRIKPSILKIAIQKNTANELEMKFMQVIGKLSLQYSLPVALHAPFSTLRNAERLIDCGVSPKKLMVAHLENGICKEDEYEDRISAAKKLARRGCFIQLSDFGSNISTDKCKKTLSLVKMLFDNGLQDQLLISSDSNWRWKNSQPIIRNANSNGGRHFTYVLTHTLPTINSVAEKDMREKLLLINPLLFLNG